MQYRFDKLQFSSLLPNYINVRTTPASIAVSGTITSGNSANYSVTIPLSGLTNFADVYASNATNKAQIVSNAAVGYIFSYVSSELVQNAVSFSGGNVTVTITVFNGTGSTITLHAQTFTIEVVEYMLPV